MSGGEAKPRREMGVRLRGLSPSRLDTITDSAFAFALTLLVISVGRLPANYEELMAALKDVPAFLAGFVAILAVWNGHRTWSRRYGLEDRTSQTLTLALVFLMLVYVYPLRMVASTFFAWVSGGRLPGGFHVAGGDELAGLFVLYGLGFAVLAALLALLHRHALSLADELGLDALERLRTRQQIHSWSLLAATGAASASWALLLPTAWGVWAGFVYTHLAVTMPWLALRTERQAQLLETAPRGAKV